MTTMIRSDVIRAGMRGWECSRVYLDNVEQPHCVYANAIEGYITRLVMSNMGKGIGTYAEAIERIEGDVKIFVPTEVGFCEELYAISERFLG